MFKKRSLEHLFFQHRLEIFVSMHYYFTIQAILRIKNEFDINGSIRLGFHGHRDLEYDSSKAVRMHVSIPEAPHC